jgi:hypothetical protein
MPIVIAPSADLDSALALTAFRRTDPITLLGGAASALRKGRWLARRRGIAHRTNVTALRVAGEQPFPWQLDGDDMGDTTELEISYRSDALTIVMP